MVIIGFSTKTSWTIARLLCGHFKHCVIITKHAHTFVLHQFVKRCHVAHIAVSERSIAQLSNNGWVFIYLDLPVTALDEKQITCVNFVKHAIGLKKFWIQTPNALYKYLKKNLTV